MASKSERHNSLGQPIGPELVNWRAATYPSREAIRGHYCSLEPLDPKRHSASLFQAYSEDETGQLWTYLSEGPFDNSAAFDKWITSIAASDDRVYFAIVDASNNNAIGVAAYLRIEPGVGSIEVGCIAYSPALQRTRAATEAMYLMMKCAFDTLGYRRYEWKCDSLNAASRSAAVRLGFQYEGIFRQAVVYKGRSRDTAWYSIIDSEWPSVAKRFEAWLAYENFDDEGRQKKSLQAYKTD